MPEEGAVPAEGLSTIQWLAGKVLVGFPTQPLKDAGILPRWVTNESLIGFPMKPLVEGGILPVKLAECLEHNQLLRACCRDIGNMTAWLFKTDPRLPRPDGFVASCRCGRNHIRVRCDPVRLGVKESEAEKLARATSILDHPFDSAPKTGDVIHARQNSAPARQGDRRAARGR